MRDDDFTYVKLYRKSLENELFLEIPYDRWHAFEFLVLKARRFPTVKILKGKQVKLNTGQLIYGEGKLAEKWGWSRGKVRRFLDLLEELEMIRRSGTPYGTLITIENYTIYQGSQPLDDTPDSTSSDTPDGTHKKKDKKDKKDNKYYGEFKNVSLSDDELEKLKIRYPYDWENRIDKLSAYMASKGKRYKSHYATILNWARRESDEFTGKNQGVKKAEGETQTKNFTDGNGMQFV